MGVPFPMQESYLGFMRDLPRHQLPSGTLWDIVDWIPQLDGAARRRFGRGYIDANQFATIHPGAINTGLFAAYAPFQAGPEVLATDGTNLFRYPNAGAGSFVLTIGSWHSRPVFHREKLILADQTALAVAYTPGVWTSIIGSPQAKCGTLYGDYTVLVNTVAQPQRAFFSAPGDPTTWDTANSWVDIPGTILGAQGIRNALLLWTDRQLWRIRGDTPPQSGVIGNLARDHLYDIGLVDERSIATYGEQVLFANGEGVWITDGAQVKNLCTVGGIETYWQSLLKNAASSWAFSGGVFRGRYIISITDTSTNLPIDCLVCDLASNRWYRVSNVPACMFAHSTNNYDRLFYVTRDHGYVEDVSFMWSTPQALDLGSTAVLPSLETPFFRGFQRLHRRWIQTDATSVWQRIYVNAEAPGTGSALRVGYTVDPQVGGAYTTVGDIAAGAGLRRTRLPINPAGGAIPARGIGFKIYQAVGMAPTDLRLNDLELEFFTREGSR